MTEAEADSSEVQNPDPVGENHENVIGHRYRCNQCGSEAIVTKGGDGSVGCCDGDVTDLTDIEAGATVE